MSEKIDKIEGICQDCIHLNKIMPIIKQLQQENKELKETLKGTTHCFDQEEHQKLKQENKELKEKLKKIQFENTYTNIVHNAFQTEKKEKRYYENILTEFEKWLEKEKSKNGLNDFYALGIYKSLDKLQELKEGNK